MKYALEILVGAIVLYIVYSIASGLGSSSYEGEVVNRSIDTVWSKPDTVIQTDTVVINRLQAHLDTVYVDSTEVITASADTVINKDSSTLRVKYFFPPLNYFDIDLDLKEKVITKEETILDSVTVEVKKPFYKDHWFWTSLISVALLIASMLGGG